MILHPEFVEALIIERTELTRQAAQAPNERCLSGDRIGVVAEDRRPTECQVDFSLALHLRKRITRQQKVREKNVRVLHGLIAIVGVMGSLEGSTYHRAAASNVFRPWHHHRREDQRNETLESAQTFALDQFVPQLAETKGRFEVAEAPTGYVRQLHKRMTRSIVYAALQVEADRSAHDQDLERLVGDCRTTMEAGDYVEDRPRRGIGHHRQRAERFDSNPFERRADLIIGSPR